MKTFNDLQQNDIVYVVYLDPNNHTITDAFKSKVTAIQKEEAFTKYFLSDFIHKHVKVLTNEKDYTKISYITYKVFINANDVLNFIEDELEEINMKYNKLKRNIK